MAIEVTVFPRELHVIVIDRLTNLFLIERGWKEGDPVVRAHSSMGGDTFDRGTWNCLDAYADAGEANRSIAERVRCFNGTTFKTIKFVLSIDPKKDSK